eukprot:355198-Chlamydomonas_euryale.AAC.4
MQTQPDRPMQTSACSRKHTPCTMHDAPCKMRHAPFTTTPLPPPPRQARPQARAHLYSVRIVGPLMPKRTRSASARRCSARYSSGCSDRVGAEPKSSASEPSEPSALEPDALPQDRSAGLGGRAAAAAAPLLAWPS